MRRRNNATKKISLKIKYSKMDQAKLIKGGFSKRLFVKHFHKMFF